ncbi:hypothetical protein EMIT0324P_120020 [Pseudomonas chlororaphis]|uniref:helix-turn-helix domain-containing protein n=1 Tax=Pseudomonas chlororaphis TaxID=587753 RepID=UPI0039E268AA
MLTPAELTLCIRLFREARQWSQEQLAAISGLNVRTIQRVEQSLSAPTRPYMSTRVRGHRCFQQAFHYSLRRGTQDH